MIGQREFGQRRRRLMDLADERSIVIVPAESTGAAVSPEQMQLRRAWLAAKAR